MGQLKVEATPFAGLFEVRCTRAGDARGHFTRLFCEEEMAPVRRGLHFTQVNLSHTHRKGTIRGLHYQVPPAAEAKFIRCLAGRVFDVAVDVRAGSPTFLKWHSVELSDDNDLAIFIPEGFAHGFQTLTDEVRLLYMHTAPWAVECEAGLRPDDPRLSIAWPVDGHTISDRDRSHALLDVSFRGIAA